MMVEILVPIPAWYAARGLDIFRPDQRMLVLFLVSEEMMSATEAARHIEAMKIQDGAPTWKAWVENIQARAAKEGWTGGKAETATRCAQSRKRQPTATRSALMQEKKGVPA